MKMDTLPPNMGSEVVGMLIDAAHESIDGLRKRVSNVRDVPIALAIQNNCECIYFDFDGQTYLGELRGRNRDLCIDSRNTEAESNRAIAVRVLLDRNAAPVKSDALIKEQLESLTTIAKARMAECNPGIAGVMGGAEIDFMTSEEKSLRHALLLSLPSQAQLRHDARSRIAQRIAARKQKIELGSA